MPERIANLGYLLIGKETTKGTPVTPTISVPYYSENLVTDGGLIKQQAIYGNKFITYATLPGQRGHQGELTTLAEPNTAGFFLDMLLTRISTTGSGPYTHTFALSNTVNPNSYTFDISMGNTVKRFWGVEASKITPNWNDNEMQNVVTVSALGSFQGRSIASVTTNTITLSTAYDPAPNKGLVAGDLVRLFKASTGATQDTTVTSVNADGITVVLGASVSTFTAGDIIHLRPATAATNLLPSFLWAKTQFKLGATAAAALAGTQTRLEQGSTFEIMHTFEDDAGAKRSGGFDPAALVRMTGDANFTIKKAFDTPEDVQSFNDQSKSAAVISHLSGPTNQYELRVTLNNLRTPNPVPETASQQINYSTIEFTTNYDNTDGQALDVKVINNIATI